MQLTDSNFYYISQTKNILKGKEGYHIESVFEPDGENYVVKNGEIDVDVLSNVVGSRCYNCSHACEFHHSLHCDIIHRILGCEWYSLATRCNKVYKCEAYDEVCRINCIVSEQEMVDFISKTENFFQCPEDYEAYFGFERQFDEETGEVLETTQEYYKRGGKFKNIPTNYPVIVVFDYNVKQNLLWESVDKLLKGKTYSLVPMSR